MEKACRRFADFVESRFQFHQDELMENREPAQKKQELFEIEPLECLTMAKSADWICARI